MSVTVPKLWSGSTVVCIGGGPSLTVEDVNFVRGRARVIAINDAYKLAPWADVLYACDGKWWNWHQGVPTFTGLRYALVRSASRWTVDVLKNTGPEGLELDPSGLRTGKNSGYQAINLAVHLGGTRVLLLGYDMQATGGKEHWFGDHPNKSPSPYPSWLREFDTIVGPLKAAGVHVVNCSRRTALTCFPQMPIEQALPMALEVAS